MSSINAVPKKFSSTDIPDHEGYHCPVSEISTSDKNEKWVYCPMVEQFICYGACLDLQAIATAREFENHPFVDDFYKLSSYTNLNVVELRKICLNHQEEILNEMLLDPLENHDEVNALLLWVKKLKSQL